MLHGLDDDDGIVDNKPDGEHQPEERERIDRKPQEGKEHEGPHQGDGDGQERDECRPPALQEDENNDDDEDQGLVEGLDDLLDALRNGQGRVQGDHVVQVGGESLFQIRHDLLGAVGGRDGVCARQLVEGDEGGGLGIESADHAVRLGPQFDSPHVFDADEGSVCVGADHDVAELLFVFEAAL